MVANFNETQPAILYQGSTAVWCAGGCGKFRYPVALVGDRPYCSDCTNIHQLKPVANNSRLFAPFHNDARGLVEGAPNSQLDINCEKARTTKRRELKKKRSPYPRKPNLKIRMLAQLESGPKNAFELCSALNAHPVCLSTAGRALAKEGLILSIRESSAVTVSWYALPQHHEQIIDKSKSGLKHAIYTALTHAPMTVLELQAVIPDHKASSISSMLYQLIRAKKIVGAGSSHFRAYGMPEQKELVEKKALERPIRDKLLHLLKNCERELHQREISRRSGVAQRTTIFYLSELESEGIIVSYFSENKRYYTLKGK